MTLKRIEDLLSENKDWQKASVAQKEVFAKRMEKVEYGYGPTMQAWCFYYYGWVDNR